MTTQDPKNRKLLQHLRTLHRRGAAQPTTQTASGVIRVTEGGYQSALRTLGIPGGRLTGPIADVTGLVYESTQGAKRLPGRGADSLLADLNGVVGERLAAGGNRLTTPMTLRCHGQALNLPAVPADLAASGKVLLLIHGLGLNDLQWHTRRARNAAQEADQGAALALQLGYTPLYLHYDTGLHISQNGHELARQLEQLNARWPVPLDEITVVAHSMGGLVIRSAAYYARRDAMRWRARLKNIVFLGTPHHGAPLERTGNWTDVILGRTPLRAPFVQRARVSSAGMTDLRYGYVLDVDWQGQDLFRPRSGSREVVPLPEGVTCFAVAGAIAARRGAQADNLVGDGLVPLSSALGQHSEARRSLAFAEGSKWIAYRTGHLALAHSPAVTQQLVRWLTPHSGS
jgi:pimeloyl-ACP methyl ester carboxylesterase